MSECTHDCSSCSADCGSRDMRAPANAKSSIKKVIAVVSGKGGVGKSTVTASLAVAMARRGHKVAVLDADITGPSIPTAFGIHERAMATDDGIQPAVTARKKAIEQNHLLLAFPALPYTHPDRYALLLLNSILGGGCSSRLFQQLREQRGLCYTVYSYLSDYADAGLLGIYTALNRDQQDAALETMISIVRDLTQEGPSQEELDRARDQAKANILMGLESVQARMSHLGTSTLLYGRVREPEEILECYDRVTREDLRNLARSIFDFPQASLSAVGRVPAAADLKENLSRLFS